MDTEDTPSPLVQLLIKPPAIIQTPRVGLRKPARTTAIQCLSNPVFENSGDDTCFITVLLTLRECPRIIQELADTLAQIEHDVCAGSNEAVIVHECLRLLQSDHRETLGDWRLNFCDVITAFSQEDGELDVTQVTPI